MLSDSIARVPGMPAESRYVINSEDSAGAVGSEIRNICNEIGFSSLESVHIRTAYSELSRNIVRYAGEGEVICRRRDDGGLTLLFVDEGPGIADVEQAMSPGFSTGGSLGLGLSGAKKLADNFVVESEPGKGTRVTFEKFGPRKRETGSLSRSGKRAGSRFRR